MKAYGYKNEPVNFNAYIPPITIEDHRDDPAIYKTNH